MENDCENKNVVIRQATKKRDMLLTVGEFYSGLCLGCVSILTIANMVMAIVHHNDYMFYGNVLVLIYVVATLLWRIIR